MVVNTNTTKDFEEKKIVQNEDFREGERRHHTIIWFNVITGSIMHIIALYGVYLLFAKAHIPTGLQVIFLHFVGVIGVTAGLHRLWTHRCYKAKWPLRLLLMVCATVSFQGTIYQWSRDHRVHHKCSDTHGDPHNINSGFFFAHIGWLLCKKFPDVTEKGSQLDLTDLLADPIVRFQKKYVHSLVILIALILPTVIPIMLWGETFTCAFCINMLRYMLTLHSTLCVNSFTHLLGRKPFDKHINPTENDIISFFMLGEGFHNYHHTFPWDYKCAEFGSYSLNSSALLIELFAKIGWAHDMKTTSKDLIMSRCLRTGDGSHEIWGWGDKDQPVEDFREATIIFKKK